MPRANSGKPRIGNSGRGRIFGSTAGGLVLLTVLLLATGVASAFKNLRHEAPLPGFVLKDLAGREWKSSEALGGTVSVITFWATWSPRSREILRDLEALRRELGPARLKIVAVNVEHQTLSAEDRKAMAELVRELDIGALVLLDDGLTVYDAFGIMAVPSSLVVDASGKVTFDLAGYPMTLRSDLADAVRKALGLATAAELHPPPPAVPKNQALMHYNLGRLLLEKGQDEKAVAQLQIAAERDPAFKMPHIELGRYHRRQGRAAEALKEFAIVRELDPADSEASYQAAILSLEEGNYSAAEDLFAHLGAEFPTREEFILGRSLALKYLGREAEASALSEKSAGLLPAAPRILYDLAAAAERRGDLAAATIIYRRGVEAALQAPGR